MISGCDDELELEKRIGDVTEKAYLNHFDIEKIIVIQKDTEKQKEE